MAKLTVQNIPSTGVAVDDTSTITYTAATATGDYADLKATPGHVLRVINGSASPIAVTISSVVKYYDGTTPSDVTVSVGASKTFDIKIDYKSMQALDDGDYRVNISYDDVTTVTVAMLHA